jgi:hypothetical protein
VELILEPIAMATPIPPSATVEIVLMANNPIEEIAYEEGRLIIWACEESVSLVTRTGERRDIWYQAPRPQQLYERLKALPFPAFGKTLDLFPAYEAALAGNLSRLAQDLPMDDSARDPSPPPEILKAVTGIRKNSRAATKDEHSFLDYYEVLEEVQISIGHAVMCGHEAGRLVPVSTGWAEREASIFSTRLDLAGIKGAAWREGIRGPAWRDDVPGPGWKRAVATGRHLEVLVQHERRLDEEFENWEWLARPEGTSEWFVPAVWYMWLDGKRWPTGHWMSRENEWFIRNINRMEERVLAKGAQAAADEMARIYADMRREGK